MRYIRINTLRGARSTNPFIQALSLVVGIALFFGAVFIGGLVIVALIGFLLVAGLIIYVRVWWLTRTGGLQRRKQEESFVEAEYQVIEPRTPDDEQR